MIKYFQCSKCKSLKINLIAKKKTFAVCCDRRMRSLDRLQYEHESEQRKFIDKRSSEPKNTGLMKKLKLKELDQTGNI